MSIHRNHFENLKNGWILIRCKWSFNCIINLWKSLQKHCNHSLEDKCGTSSQQWGYLLCQYLERLEFRFIGVVWTTYFLHLKNVLLFPKVTDWDANFTALTTAVLAKAIKINVHNATVKVLWRLSASMVEELGGTINIQ